MTRPHNLRRIVSGGQTGADQAGLRAARAAGIENGGWAPKGWATEDGPALWLAEFGLIECPIAGYPARTEANARDSDGTIWFGSQDSSGFRVTMNACRRYGKPTFIFIFGQTTPDDVTDWIPANRICVLNIAGNRESKSPGIAERVGDFLATALSSLMAQPDASQTLTPESPNQTTLSHACGKATA